MLNSPAAGVASESGTHAEKVEVLLNNRHLAGDLACLLNHDDPSSDTEKSRRRPLEALQLYRKLGLGPHLQPTERRSTYFIFGTFRGPSTRFAEAPTVLFGKGSIQTTTGSRTPLVELCWAR